MSRNVLNQNTCAAFANVLIPSYLCPRHIFPMDDTQVFGDVDRDAVIGTVDLEATDNDIAEPHERP
jgi:hypothetical protein